MADKNEESREEIRERFDKYIRDALDEEAEKIWEESVLSKPEKKNRLFL